MTLTLTERNLDLEAAQSTLKEQHNAKYDIVTHSDLIRYQNGKLSVIDERGTYFLNPTDQFESGISSRLEIPRRYLRRLRDDAVEHDSFNALDTNVNHWLRRSDRNWFVRGFKLNGDPGVARAFLSDRYNCIDHIDALFATLEGIANAGVRNISVEAVDLSEKRLRVKITSPSIQAAVPQFLKDYRSPFTGDRGDESPLIYAGLVMSNSETGAGAFQIAPHITIEVCKNGMTRTSDAQRKVHLGERMDEGVIQWSAETRQAGIELVKSQARDTVTTFLSQAYLQDVADELEESAGAVFSHPAKAVEQVSKEMKYTEDEQERIMAMFMSGGDPSAGGLVNAVTALAQTIPSPDRAAELEESAFDALKVGVKVAAA